MIAAVQGGGKPPLWVNVLDAAAEWGKAPWEITGDSDRMTWFIRWQEYTRQKRIKENSNGRNA